MGVAVADYDEDGYFDIVKTNFSDDVPNLYHNNGDGTFEDGCSESGLGGYMAVRRLGRPFPRRGPRRPQGHAADQRSRLSGSGSQTPGCSYRQPRLLYWNVGGGKFKDCLGSSGPGHREPLVVARLGRRATSTTTARSRW